MTAHGLTLTFSPAASGQRKTFRKTACMLLPGCAFLCLLLFLLPAPRNGLLLLANSLTQQSEKVNRYVYTRFEVPPDASTAPAIWLLAALAFFLLLLLILSESRIPALTAALLLAGVQAWIGLCLPFWGNVGLFTFLGLLMLPDQSKRALVPCLITVFLIALAVFYLRPQTDYAVEQASEHVRDVLSQAMAGSGGGSAADSEPEPLPETRHVNPYALASGDETARAEKEYRLITLGEKQISRPHWVRILRIIGLLFLAVLVIVLPLLPFVILARRQKKTREIRRGFLDENPAAAVSAMFLHVVRYLDCSGLGEGNRLFRDWGAADAASFPYWPDFHACSLIYEQAIYSSCSPTPKQLEQVKNLLQETETLLFDQADWKQKFRLRYRECLHE